MRRPGHENCPTCPECGLSDCPDCDTLHEACTCRSRDTSARDPVDIPLYRRRPRRKKEKP